MATRIGRRTRARRRWLVALALAGIVLLHGVIMVRLLFSPEQFRLRTRALLQQQWPGAVSLGEAAYEFPAGFRLGEIGLDRPSERGGDRLLSAKALMIRCGLLAALRGHLRVDELVVEGPELFLETEDLRVLRGKKGEGPRADFGRVVLRDGRIHIGKGMLFEGSPAQELRALSVELVQERRLENGFRFEGEAESDLWGRCTLQGTVDLQAKRFEAAVVARDIRIGPQLRALLPAKALAALDRYNFQGAVHLTLRPTLAWGGPAPRLDLRAEAELADCTAAWDRFPVPCTDLRGQVVYDGTNVYYRNIRGRAGPATLTIEGSTTRDKVELDVTVRGRPLDEELREAAPPPLQRVWQRCGIQGGIIDVDSHSVWHRAERVFEATVTVRVREGRATHTNFPYPLSDITGVLVWRGTGSEKLEGREPGVTQIRSLTGRHGSARVQLSGEARDDGVLNITLQGFDVPLDAALYGALHERWQKTYDQFRPAGTVAFECRITGPTREPLRPQYRIVLRPEGVAFRHVKFPHTVENVRGEIRIDEEGRVTLHDLTGRLGDIPLKFLGSVTPGPKGPVSDITVVAPEVELSPRVRSLLAEGWAAAYDQLQPRGTVAFTWQLAEDPAAGTLRRTSEIRCLRQCSVQHKRFPIRIAGLLGTIYVEDTGETTFTGMKGRIGDAIVEAIDGHYVPGPEGGLRFTLKASGLDLDEPLRRALPATWQKVWDELQPRGEADVEYHYASKAKEPDRPAQRVSIEPRNATVTPRKFPLPITAISRGKVTFDQDGNATLSDLQGKALEKTVHIAGKAESGPEKTLLRLDVAASDVPLVDELRKALPEPWQKAWTTCGLAGTAGVAATLETDLRAGTWGRVDLTLTLKGTRACYAPFPIPLTDLRGRVEVDDGVVTLTDVVAQSPVADQVRLEGRVGADAECATRLRVQAQNLRFVPRLLEALPAQVRKPLQDSELSGAADLDVTVCTPREAGGPAASFFGKVDLRGCSFRRGHPVQEVDGGVRVEKGQVGAQGALELTGTLELRKLVVRRLVATGLQGQFAYTSASGEGPEARPPLLAFTGLQGSFYGGRLSVPKAEVDLEGGAIRQASVLLTDVDFKDFCREGLAYKKNVSGVLDLKLEVPPGELEDTGLVGDGVARVAHGELGDLPVAAAIFDVLSFQLPERSITKGEMKFGIAADKLLVKRISLGREGWLMTGWGTVGFDHSLALKFVTPKTGSILALPRIIAGTLVEVDVGGTLNKPETGQTLVPVSRVYEEFKRILKVW